MTEVGRLCVRTSEADAQASASRTAVAVRPLDLDSPSVPERAILCIRRMDDPLPGGIDTRSTHTRPTRWEHAAREAIGALYRSAPRLLRDEVSTHANAVVFEDRAELLACAAQSLQSRAWWWTNVIASPLTIDAVVREWLRTPAYVPGAIALLDAPTLRTFLLALEAAKAVQLTKRVLEVHGIPSIARALEETRVARFFSHVVTTRLASVSSRAVIEDASLAIECRAFAAIALALHESPVMTKRVLEEAADSPIAITPQTPAPLTPPVPHESIAPANESRHPPAPVERRALNPSKGSLSPSERAHEESHAQPLVEEEETTGGLRARRSTGTARTSAVPAMQETQHAQAQTQASRSTTAPAAGTAALFGVEPLHTPYAGLFFLLNAAIALGYYDPYGRGEDIDLDVWEFLAMCGHEFLPKFEDDALFAFLHHDDELARTEEWLDAIRAYVIDALPDVDEPETFLLARAGTLLVTPAHIDIHFTLATHPIEIRIAGLDRDPGWIPAAGRHVAFHFD